MPTSDRISLKQLRYFLQVCEAGSISAAARALNVSQPAIGMQIKQLEADMKVDLLARSTAGVSPTDAGIVVLRTARDIINALQRMGNEVKEATSREVLVTLGVTTTSGRALVSSLLEAVRSHRGTHTYRLSLREGRSDDLISMLRLGEIDAALSYEEAADEKARAVLLYEEEFVLVGRSAVMRGADPFVTKELLKDVALVVSPAEQGSRAFLEREARERGIQFRFEVEMSSATLKEQMLLRHDKCMVVPYARFRAEIQRGELAAVHFVPALRRKMKLHLRRGITGRTSSYLQSLLLKSIDRLIKSEDLGWTHPAIQGSNPRPAVKNTP